MHFYLWYISEASFYGWSKNILYWFLFLFMCQCQWLLLLVYTWFGLWYICMWLQDDILPKLMTITGSHEDLFRKEISKYDHICEDIAHNIEAQEQLLYQIQVYVLLLPWFLNALSSHFSTSENLYNVLQQVHSILFPFILESHAICTQF